MPTRLPDLYTAAELAEFCQVVLKTVHNWAEHGELRHFRTPGRHLRFRQGDVVDFLRRYGYPVPDALFVGRAPRVYVIDGDASWLKAVQRALGKIFTVTTFEDPVDGIVAIGADVPDAAVIDLKMAGLDGYRCLARLRDLPTTSEIKTIACSTADAGKKSLDAGAFAFVLKPDVGALTSALEHALGVDAAASS